MKRIESIGNTEKSIRALWDNEKWSNTDIMKSKIEKIQRKEQKNYPKKYHQIYDKY